MKKYNLSKTILFLLLISCCIQFVYFHSFQKQTTVSIIHQSKEYLIAQNSLIESAPISNPSCLEISLTKEDYQFNCHSATITLVAGIRYCPETFQNFNELHFICQENRFSDLFSETIHEDIINASFRKRPI